MSVSVSGSCSFTTFLASVMHQELFRVLQGRGGGMGTERVGTALFSWGLGSA